MVTRIMARVREGVCIFVQNKLDYIMKLNYQRPELSGETVLSDLAFLEAASGRIQDYEEIPDTWN